MRFVAVKTVDQQSVLMLHKVRELLVRQRTMLISALRGHLAEFGIVASRGPGGVTAVITALHEAQDGLPELARQVLHGLIGQMRVIDDEIAKAEKHIMAWHRANEASRRLATHSRDWPDNGQRYRCGGAGRHTLSIRPPVRSLARIDAARSQQRW